jgi:hypothetical protein
MTVGHDGVRSGVLSRFFGETKPALLAVFLGRRFDETDHTLLAECYEVAVGIDE